MNHKMILFITLIITIALFFGCSNTNETTTNNVHSEKIITQKTTSTNTENIPHENFFGHWIIKRELAYGRVGTYSKDDIKKMIGKDMSFSSERASCFGDDISYLGETIENPIYENTVISENKFESDNYVTFDKLGVKSNSIIQITAANSNDNGCTFFIKDDNTLIVVGGGVFLELERKQQESTSLSPTSSTKSTSLAADSSNLKEKATLTTDEVTKLMQKFHELEDSAYADMTDSSGFYIFFQFNAIDGKGTATTWTVNPSNGDVYDLSGKIVLNLLTTPTTVSTPKLTIAPTSKKITENEALDIIKDIIDKKVITLSEPDSNCQVQNFGTSNKDGDNYHIIRIAYIDSNNNANTETLARYWVSESSEEVFQQDLFTGNLSKVESSGNVNTASSKSQDNLVFTMAEIESYFLQSKQDLIKHFGKDYSEGALTIDECHVPLNVVMYHNGLTFFNLSDNDSTPTRIECSDGVEIDGLKNGMSFNQIQKVFGKKEIAKTWIANEENVAYKMTYTFDKVSLEVLSYNTDGSNSYLAFIEDSNKIHER